MDTMSEPTRQLVGGLPRRPQSRYRSAPPACSAAATARVRRRPIHNLGRYLLGTCLALANATARMRPH
jgi:hypothetical protein